MSASRIEYSEKYADDGNEYRCVVCLYRLDRPSNIKCSEVWLFVVTGRTAFALISTQKKPRLMEDLQIHYLLRNQSQLQLDMRYRHELIHLISFNSITLLQTCHSSQGFGQDVAKESSVDGSRMARYWRPAVSRMATLCDSSVRFHTLPTIILFLLVIFNLNAHTCTKLRETHWFFPISCQQSWTTHSALSSSLGNRSSKWSRGSRIGTCVPWGVQESVWYFPQVDFLSWFPAHTLYLLLSLIFNHCGAQ